MNKEKFYAIEKLLTQDGYKALCLWIRHLIQQNEELQEIKSRAPVLKDLLAENERLYKALMEARKK